MTGESGRRAVLGAIASGVIALLAPGTAAAATCQTGSVTFDPTGGEQCYQVPAGVHELLVTAVGGMGGTATSPGGAGGLGAVVGGAVPVTPGETLYVEVGSNGTPDGAPAFGGGAGGGARSASGGGASDIRTISRLDAGSLGSRLLVAAGGGGGGAPGVSANINTGPTALPGGAGGDADIDQLGNGSSGVDGTGVNFGTPGLAGAGGTLTGAGVGGAGGVNSVNSTPVSAPAGTGGSFGAGGAGSGGGGGGGYYGGGGGGAGASVGVNQATAGGGGAGSSFAAPEVTRLTLGQDPTCVPRVTIAPAVGTPAVAPAGGLSFAGTQAEQTISAPQTLTVTNTGNVPLQIASLTFGGADPQDFLIASNGCLGQIAVGAQCAIGVSFAPQGQGARRGTLEIAGNSPAVVDVPLSGTGGPPAQGLPGPTGATGQRGPAGAIELVTCKTVTSKRVVGKGVKRHTVHVRRQLCTARLVSGKVTFRTTGPTAHATVSRGRVAYATGVAVPAGAGGWQLVLQDRRKLRPGRYELTLRTTHGRRSTTRRMQITVT
jgi:hypothetical protein